MVSCVAAPQQSSRCHGFGPGCRPTNLNSTHSAISHTSPPRLTAHAGRPEAAAAAAGGSARLSHLPQSKPRWDDTPTLPPARPLRAPVPCHPSIAIVQKTHQQPMPLTSSPPADNTTPGATCACIHSADYSHYSGAPVTVGFRALLVNPEAGETLVLQILAWENPGAFNSVLQL